MDNIKKNMEQEYSVLKLRIKRMTAFVSSIEYHLLPDSEKSDIEKQLEHMQEYLNILRRRLSK